MKGICFKEELFHATIDGRKTQTRRIMNPQPEEFIAGEPCFWVDNLDDEFTFEDGGYWQEIKPRYKVGDIIYLKEPYHVFDEENKLCLYRFSPKEEWLTDEEHASIVASIESLNGWRNKLFMPESAARYFIKITAVRAERLQDISDEDCFNEGIEFTDYGGNIVGVYGLSVGVHFTKLGSTPREAYAALIDKINGKDTWDSNPWVWTYDYELTESVKPKEQWE